jgi:dynein heavy chain
MADIQRQGSNSNLLSHETGGAATNTNTTTAAALDSKKKAAGVVNIVEKKRASLDVRHRYLLEKFAAYIDEKPAALENSLLLGNKLDIVNEFFAEGGTRKVLFFWQPSSGKVKYKMDTTS